jgi:membrane dipeptidase
MMSSNNPISERAAALHRAALVIDGSEAAPMTPAHFDRLHKGGINALNTTVIKNMAADFSDGVLHIQDMLETIQKYSDRVTLVRKTADIQQAQAQGKIGVILGLQNARPIMSDLRYLRLLHNLGVRIIQLTYNERNLLGDGCIEKANGGLSRFGRAVVKEMNRSGVLVDASHCCEQTTIEAIEESELPIAITHSNAKALSPSPRNKADPVLKLLAKHGGVIGAVMWAPIAYSDPKKRPGRKEFFAILDHLVQQAGIDHVGIGSDNGEGETREEYEAMFKHGGGSYPEITAILGDWYGWEGRMVEGMEQVTVFPEITEELLKRGYKDEDIRKILGGNWLRLYGAVWDRASNV